MWEHFFCTQECLKSTQQANPIEFWTIDKMCPYVGPSVCFSYINFLFKHLLLWNYLSNFDEISQKYSCHGPLQNVLKEFDSL